MFLRQKIEFSLQKRNTHGKWTGDFSVMLQDGISPNETRMVGSGDRDGRP